MYENFVRKCDGSSILFKYVFINSSIVPVSNKLLQLFTGAIVYYLTAFWLKSWFLVKIMVFGKNHGF